MTVTAQAIPRGLAPPAASRPDYAGWSVEELRAFAAQLRLPDAHRKNRGELLDIFTVAPRKQ